MGDALRGAALPSPCFRPKVSRNKDLARDYPERVLFLKDLSAKYPMQRTYLAPEQGASGTIRRRSYIAPYLQFKLRVKGRLWESRPKLSHQGASAEGEELVEDAVGHLALGHGGEFEGGVGGEEGAGVLVGVEASGGA